MSELRGLIGAQQSLLTRLSAAGQLTPDEQALQRRLLVLATEELSRRTERPPRDPMESFWPAMANWDLFNFQVPQSHRASMVGRAITGTKRLFLSGLRELHCELLRPQRAFNHELVDRLRPAVEFNDPVNNAVVADSLRAALVTLKDTPVSAPPATLSERSYQQLIARWVEPALARQRTWNAQVIEAALATLSPHPLSLPQLHQLLGQLGELGRLPVPRELKGAARATFPLWFELLRRQQLFNDAIVKTLAALHDLPRPADDGRYTYPQALLTHEARRMAEVARELKQLRATPLISVITPTWRTPPAVLTACLESLLAQSYPHWELCVVDDGSGDPASRTVLEQFALRDPRIRPRFNLTNGGIARATNDALALARGEFVAFLDHDDTLAPHALGEVALHLAHAPDTDFLYTDEDRLDTSGRRVLPFFKPGWSPDLLRAVNYVCHLLVARRSLVEEVGRIREGFEGAQDYDLVLRLSERAKRVGHIAEVLYHWRASPQSTAMNVANKPEAARAGIRALTAHLRARGEHAHVVSPEPTHYQVRYELPSAMAVALVVAAPGPHSPLVATLDVTRYESRRLVKVGGDGATVPWHGARDLGAMYEEARRQVHAAVYVFLDGELSIVDPDWLEELVGQALRPEIGVVGPKLVYPDETIQDAGWVLNGHSAPLRPFEHMADLGEWTAMGSPNWTRNYLAVSPRCFAVRAEVLERLGGFHPGLSAPATVLDLCLRANDAGLRVLYTPHARLMNHAPEESLEGVVTAHRPDPFFNAHLSPNHTNGGLRQWLPGETEP